MDTDEKEIERQPKVSIVITLERITINPLYKRDFNKQTGRLLQDKIFLCVYASEFQGILVKKFGGGVNRWMTVEEFHKQPKRFVCVDDFTDLMERGIHYVERELYYDEADY